MTKNINCDPFEVVSESYCRNEYNNTKKFQEVTETKNKAISIQTFMATTYENSAVKTKSIVKPVPQRLKKLLSVQNLASYCAK